jgi:hypothetical protein
MACLLLYEPVESVMQKDPSGWVTFFLAAAAALALSFLLGGCASGRREPAPGAPAVAEGWGACDRSRMVSVMLVCRQTKTEPVSDSSH